MYYRVHCSLLVSGLHSLNELCLSSADMWICTSYPNVRNPSCYFLGLLSHKLGRGGMFLCVPLPPTQHCAWLITFEWMFDSGQLGPVGFILDKEVSASEYFEWDIFILGWEKVSPLLWIGINLYRSLSSTSCYIWQIGDTHKIKWLAQGNGISEGPAGISLGTVRITHIHIELYGLQSTLTWIHFYLGCTDLILPSLFYTAKETEAMEFKWSPQDYLANEGRPTSSPDRKGLFCSELFLWFSWTIHYSTPTAKILFRLSMNWTLPLSLIFQNQKPEKKILFCLFF